MNALEQAMRAVAAAIGGDPERWRDIVGMVRGPVLAVIPFLSAAAAAELQHLFSHEIGEGPSDPDPGF